MVNYGMSERYCAILISEIACTVLHMWWNNLWTCCGIYTQNYCINYITLQLSEGNNMQINELSDLSKRSW